MKENEELIIVLNEGGDDVAVYHQPDGMWLKGSVYPISIYDRKKLEDGVGFYYNSATSSDAVEDREQARILFDFMFCWRGVWEGRINFKDDEYWSEEIKSMAQLWETIEPRLKQILREKDPENEYMRKDE